MTRKEAMAAKAWMAEQHGEKYTLARDGVDWGIKKIRTSYGEKYVEREIWRLGDGEEDDIIREMAAA